MTTTVARATWLVPSTLDGGDLDVVSYGEGPGVVFVHGGGIDATVYRRPAERLAVGFAVHVYNRRGRGRSAPRPADYGLATEIGDLGSVLDATGSSRVVGHSVGGFFAIAAARELPIERLALFDPAVDVDGTFPTDYLPEFERAIGEGDTLGAMRIMGRGLRNPGSDLPLPVQKAAVRLVLLTPPGRIMASLLDTVPAEARMAAAADGPASDWAGVTATTRFYIGQRSPDYYLPTARALAAAMPHADVEPVPRLGHDALARAPRALIDSLGRFLAG